MKNLKNATLYVFCLVVFAPAPALANALPFPLDLSVTPQSTEETTVDIMFASDGSFLFAFGTSFSTTIDIQGSEILVSIAVIPRPPLPPGSLTSPSFFLFDRTLSLGLLPEGEYSLNVSLFDTAQVVGAGSTTFSVIPEPSVATLLGLGLFALSRGRPSA